MPSITGRLQQRHASTPLTISSPRRSWKCDVSSSKCHPQYGQRRTSSVSIRMLSVAEMLEYGLAGELDRRAPELLDAEELPGLVLVDPRHRVARAHLRPVAAERRQLARHPVAHVDHE